LLVGEKWREKSLANHASALKRHRQAEKRRTKNSSVKSNIKTALKRVKSTIAEGKAPEATEAVRHAISALDKAASKGVLHRRNASRKASRLARLLNATTTVKR
jgi:small subunit ribosomal protein S20